MRNIFTEHPNSVNETYFQHFRFACCFAVSMFFAAAACFLHALFPFWFKDTASIKIYKIVDCLKKNGRWQKLQADLSLEDTSQ